jgi:hypothetical protein
MNWVAWLALANVFIMGIEYVYRVGTFVSFWHALPWLIVPILGAQLALYEGFRHAPTLFVAGAVFTLIGLIFRAGNTLIIGEPFGVWQMAGILLMGVAVIIFKL